MPHSPSPGEQARRIACCPNTDRICMRRGDPTVLHSGLCDKLTKDIAAALARAREEALDARDAETQERLFALLSPGDSDGAGCESGDPLDVTEAAMRCKIEGLQDACDENAREIMRLQGELAEARATYMEMLRELNEARGTLRAACVWADESEQSRERFSDYCDECLGKPTGGDCWYHRARSALAASPGRGEE